MAKYPTQGMQRGLCHKRYLQGYQNLSTASSPALYPREQTHFLFPAHVPHGVQEESCIAAKGAILQVEIPNIIPITSSQKMKCKKYFGLLGGHRKITNILRAK